eukprot:m.181189 g.181189  ORF g.181189 m.181189 type:complete len:321 (+) comp18442_c0_seq1:209-1171(+)
MQSQFISEGIHGQSVVFSPFEPGILALVGSQHFGIAGCGQLSILQQVPGTGNIIERNRLEWPDGLFDAAWSEEHENQIATCSGDGCVQLWDLGLPNAARGPISVYRGHEKEVVSVDWCQTRGPPMFLSASWDTTVKLWNPLQPAQPVATFAEHMAMVYQAVWSPRKQGVFASCSGDGTLKIWDARTPPHAMQTFQAHRYEVLSCDWNKYDENLIVTGSVDKSIAGFDIRRGPGGPPLFALEGHTYAVRRVKCSPHHRSLVASCSYDFTTRLWDPALPAPQRLVSIFDDHTEFVIGLDFSLHQPNTLADCSWDERVALRQF